MTFEIITYMYMYMITTLIFSSDIEGVLSSANATEYGLASGVFTKDLSKVSFITKYFIEPLRICRQPAVLLSSVVL